MGTRIARWLVVAVVAVLMLNAAIASAGTVSVPLSQTSLGDLVVDDANQRVFISSPANNSVAVFDFSGNLVTTLANLPGATGMVIAGSTLYVAENTGGAIEKIDLSTLAPEGALATGLSNPTRIAYAGGLLWATVCNLSKPCDQLASITQAGKITIFKTPYYHADLASSPATPNDLYVSEDFLAPDIVYKLDVSGSSPVVLAQNISTPNPQSPMTDLAISPDGTRVIPAGFVSGDFEELGASTLEPDGVTYPAVSNPSAVGVSAGDGGLLATGVDVYNGAPDIAVFPLGVGAPIFTAGTAGADGASEIAPHGLALSADGSRMFAVSIDPLNNSLEFWIFNLDLRATATGVSASPNPSDSGQPITLTATVAPTDGGGTVSFDANGQPIAGCRAVSLSSASPGATATCDVASLPGGTDSIGAAYSGDGAYEGSTGTTTATVELPPGSDYTWSGMASHTYSWSASANWAQTVAPYGSVGTLTFPNLSITCPTVTCVSYNDIAGLAADAIVIDSDTPYEIDGDPLVLGAGGLTAESPSANGSPSFINLPITLGVPQTWTVAQGPTKVAAVTGNQPLSLNFSTGSIEPVDNVEVGAVTATGAGGFYLDGSMGVNSTDLSPSTLSSGAGIEADQANNSVGPVSVGAGGWLSVGGIDNGGGTLAVDGALTFNGGSELDLAVDAPGTTAGLDYSQVTATGNVDLSGAQLNVAQGPDLSGNCDDLNPGAVLTLVSTTGTLSGTFTNYPNGAAVDIVNACDGANQDATGTLTYSSSAVTLTITGAGNAGAGAPVELTPPSLYGRAQVGQTLQVDPGVWQGATSFDYSWWACGMTTCTQIPNASSSTFQLTTAQLGDQIGAIVTAVGPGGTSYDYTNLSAVVTAQPTPPQSSPTVFSPPTITGTPMAGDVLTATTGIWKNSPSSYFYQWERCSPTATGCVAIPGAKSQTYVLTSADVGSAIEVQVTAANSGGMSPPASSVPTSVVTAAASGQITPAAVTAALRSVLSPTGKAASLASVLSHHGYTFSFHAPGAGKLAVTWTATVKHKTVLVAKGIGTANAANAMKLFVRLTGAGVSALKRSAHLKIKSVATFTPSGMKSINESSTFKLPGRSAAHEAHRAELGRRTQRPAGITQRLLTHLFGDRSVSRARTRIPRSAFTQP